MDTHESRTHIPDSVTHVRALTNHASLHVEIGVNAMQAITYGNGQFSEPDRIALWLQLHDGPLCLTLTLAEAHWLAEVIGDQLDALDAREDF